MFWPVEIEVGQGEREPDVHIDEFESLDDVAEAVATAYHAGRLEIVLDLRARGRPALTLPQVVERALETLGDVAPGATLRCLVVSEGVAESLRSRLHAAPRHSSFRVGDVDVELRTGDISTVRADAIVNASNTMLKLGAGVSGALRRACGPGLQEEMSARAPIDNGGLAATGAHGLPGVARILHVATASGGEDIVRRASSTCCSTARGPDCIRSPSRRSARARAASRGRPARPSSETRSRSMLRERPLRAGCAWSCGRRATTKRSRLP